MELRDFEEIIDETTIIPNDPLRQRKNDYSPGLTLSDNRNSLSGDSVTTLAWLRHAWDPIEKYQREKRIRDKSVK